MRSNWRVLVFATVISLGTTIFFGMRPALQATKRDIRSALVITTYQFRLKARLVEVLRKIEDRHRKAVITVLLRYEDFEGLLETIDILSDSRTAEGIRKGLKDVQSGQGNRFK